MSVRRFLVLLPILGLLLSGCAGRSADDRETDRAAQTLTLAISYPRQVDAAGWARAAQDTNGGRSGEIVVLEAEDLAAEDPMAASARLEFLVHFDATNDTFGEQPAIDTCYRADFNSYGVIGEPRRTRCPAHPRSLEVPPAPPTAEIPVGFDRVLTRVLRRTGAAPGSAGVRGSVLRRLGTPTPDVDVAVVGDDVGVAVHAGDSCLFGARIGGRVRVYVPPRMTVAPGESSCDAHTAMGPVLEPPH